MGRCDKPPIAVVLAYYCPEWSPPTSSQRGGWVKCLCPFHAEKTESASVNYLKNKIHCFACDLSLDSFDVIQRQEGIGFIEAARLAESRFGRSREEVQRPVRGKPSRTLRTAPRFGAPGIQAQTRVRFRAGYRP